MSLYKKFLSVSHSAFQGVKSAVKTHGRPLLNGIIAVSDKIRKISAGLTVVPILATAAGVGVTIASGVYHLSNAVNEFLGPEPQPEVSQEIFDADVEMGDPSPVFTNPPIVYNAPQKHTRASDYEHNDRPIFKLRGKRPNLVLDEPDMNYDSEVPYDRAFDTRPAKRTVQPYSVSARPNLGFTNGRPGFDAGMAALVSI